MSIDMCSHAVSMCMLCRPDLGLQLAAAKRGHELLRTVLRLWTNGELALDPEASFSLSSMEGTFRGIQEYIDKPCWQPSARPLKEILDELLTELLSRVQLDEGDPTDG